MNARKIADAAETAHQKAQREQVNALIPLSGDETLELCAKDLRERIRRMQAELNDIESALEERRT